MGVAWSWRHPFGLGVAGSAVHCRPRRGIVRRLRIRSDADRGSLSPASCGVTRTLSTENSPGPTVSSGVNASSHCSSAVQFARSLREAELEQIEKVRRKIRHHPSRTSSSSSGPFGVWPEAEQHGLLAAVRNDRPAQNRRSASSPATGAPCRDVASAAADRPAAAGRDEGTSTRWLPRFAPAGDRGEQRHQSRHASIAIRTRVGSSSGSSADLAGRHLVVHLRARESVAVVGSCRRTRRSAAASPRPCRATLRCAHRTSAAQLRRRPARRGVASRASPRRGVRPVTPADRAAPCEAQHVGSSSENDGSKRRGARRQRVARIRGSPAGSGNVRSISGPHVRERIGRAERVRGRFAAAAPPLGHAWCIAWRIVRLSAAASRLLRDAAVGRCRAAAAAIDADRSPSRSRATCGICIGRVGRASVLRAAGATPRSSLSWHAVDREPLLARR